MCKAYYGEDRLQTPTASSGQPSRRAPTCAILVHPLRPADRNIVRSDLSRLHIGAAERKVLGGSFRACSSVTSAVQRLGEVTESPQDRSRLARWRLSEPRERCGGPRNSAMILALLSNVPPENSLDGSLKVSICTSHSEKESLSTTTRCLTWFGTLGYFCLCFLLSSPPATP